MFKILFKKSSYTNKFNYKQLLIPSIFTFIMLLKNKNYNRNNLAFCGGQEDEEKQNISKNINHKILKIEKKLDYLLERENFKISIKDYPRFSKNVNNLLKKVLDEKTWRKNIMLTTEEGHNINDIIQPGLDNPDHPIGVVATSKDSYYTFDDILINIAQSYHNRNLPLKKYEKENFALLKNLINNLEDLLKKIIEEVEISSNRNLENNLFSSKISRSDRRDLARSILQVIKTEENEIFDENGKFLSLEDTKDLFNSNNQNPFFKSCGFYRDWPDGRFIYVNNSNTLTLVVNEEDHLKMIQRCDFNQKENHPVKFLLNYFDFLEKLHDKLNFAFDENLGYLTSLVSNLGSGLNFSIKIKVNKEKSDMLEKHFTNISELSTKLVGEKDDLKVFEISNNSTFYNFSKFLLELAAIKDLFN